MATPAVVVLIPPPVDPGEAPIHINKRYIITVGKLIAVKSTLLKPAVRGVTLPRKLVIIFPVKVGCWVKWHLAQTICRQQILSLTKDTYHKS
jgi:hypothetical protein